MVLWFAFICLFGFSFWIQIRRNKGTGRYGKYCKQTVKEMSRYQKEGHDTLSHVRYLRNPPNDTFCVREQDVEWFGDDE
jgi:hypothetical protein